MLIRTPCGQRPGIGNSDRRLAGGVGSFCCLANPGVLDCFVRVGQTTAAGRLHCPRLHTVEPSYISPSVGFFWFSYSSTSEVPTSSPVSASVGCQHGTYEALITTNIPTPVYHANLKWTGVVVYPLLTQNYVGDHEPS